MCSAPNSNQRTIIVHHIDKTSNNTSYPPYHIAGFISCQTKKTSCSIKIENYRKLAHHHEHYITCMKINYQKCTIMQINNRRIVINEDSKTLIKKIKCSDLTPSRMLMKNAQEFQRSLAILYKLAAQNNPNNY